MKKKIAIGPYFLIVGQNTYMLVTKTFPHYQSIIKKEKENIDLSAWIYSPHQKASQYPIVPWSP